MLKDKLGPNKTIVLPIRGVYVDVFDRFHRVNVCNHGYTCGTNHDTAFRVLHNRINKSYLQNCGRRSFKSCVEILLFCIKEQLVQVLLTETYEKERFISHHVHICDHIFEAIWITKVFLYLIV